MPATQPWTDEPVELTPGPLQFSASGTVNFVSASENISATWPSGPEGDPTCIASPQQGAGYWLLDGAPCWSLVGLITSRDDGEDEILFRVGSGTTIDVPSKSHLFLGVNDESRSAYADNSGSFTAEVWRLDPRTNLSPAGRPAGPPT